MKRAQYFDPKTGRWLEADNLRGGIIPDGGRLRVGIDLMDGAASRDLQARTPLQDAEDRRTAAYEDYVRRLDPLTPAKSDQFDTAHRKPDLVQLQDAADRAYARYVADLSAGNYHGRAAR